MYHHRNDLASFFGFFTDRQSVTITHSHVGSPINALYCIAAFTEEHSLPPTRNTCWFWLVYLISAAKLILLISRCFLRLTTWTESIARGRFAFPAGGGGEDLLDPKKMMSGPEHVEDLFPPSSRARCGKAEEKLRERVSPQNWAVWPLFVETIAAVHPKEVGLSLYCKQLRIDHLF